MTRYIILRGSTQTARGFGPRSSQFKQPEVRVESLSSKDVKDALTDPLTRALAPVMPIRFIEPKRGTEQGSGDGKGDAWGIAAIGANRNSFTGAGVTVAVLDTGIDADHPAFKGVNVTLRDFTRSGTADENGHGTHCAGTFFGQDVGGRRIGVARGVGRALVAKVLCDDGGGGTDMLIEALHWALLERAQVVSMSLGFDFPGMVAQMEAEGWPAQLATSEALRAFQSNLRLFDRTVSMLASAAEMRPAPLVVAAAGNESRREVSREYRIGTSLPAAADGVLSVGAAGLEGGLYRIADFSNVWPSVIAPGVDILSARSQQRRPRPGEHPGNLEVMSGTSMACPHVAGIAAMWVEKMNSKRATVTHRGIISQITVGASKEGFAAKHDEADIGDGFVQAP